MNLNVKGKNVKFVLNKKENPEQMRSFKYDVGTQIERVSSWTSLEIESTRRLHKL